MTPDARELDDARRSEARNGSSRAYCRLYVSADGGSELKAVGAKAGDE